MSPAGPTPADISPQDNLVSVVIPVFRNRDTVQALRDRLRRVFTAAGLSAEFIFVDDACPDGSGPAVEAMAQQDPWTRAVHMDERVGQHRAVLAGLATARGRWAVVMDADLQDPPEAIPRLLDELHAGYAAVFAGRRGRYESPVRLVTARVFKRLLHHVAGVASDAGMFFAADRRMIAALLETEAGPSVVAMVGLSGLPHTSIPVVRDSRTSGRSAYRGWNRLRAGISTLLWVARRRWGAHDRGSRPRAPHRSDAR